MPNEQNIQGLPEGMRVSRIRSVALREVSGTDSQEATVCRWVCELEPAIPDSPLSTAPLSESDIARGRELIAQHPEWSDPAWQNRPLRITGVSAGQTREAFFRFDLEDGGRISIPPDQVMRLYNEGEERKILDSPASPTSCEFCNGTGHTEHGFQDCADCGGTGVVTPTEITDSQRLVAACEKLDNFAWACVQTDCTEAQDYLRGLIQEMRGSLAAMKESQRP